MYIGLFTLTSTLDIIFNRTFTLKGERVSQTAYRLKLALLAEQDSEEKKKKYENQQEETKTLHGTKRNFQLVTLPHPQKHESSGCNTIAHHHT